MTHPFSIAQARADAVEASWALRYLPVPPQPGWEHRAACGGAMELFACDEIGAAGAEARRRAIDVCRDCPVRLQCLRAAAVEEDGASYVFGVRGGFNASTRRSMARTRRREQRRQAVTAR